MHEHVYKLVVASLSNNFAFVLTKAKIYMCGPFSHLSKFPKRFLLHFYCTISMSNQSSSRTASLNNIIILQELKLQNCYGERLFIIAMVYDAKKMVKTM